MFFVVREGVEADGLVQLRPLGIGGSGRIVFEGADGVQTIEAPDVGEPSASFDGEPAVREVRVVREASDAAVIVVVRQGDVVRTRVMAEEQRSQTVEVAGDGPVGVFLFLDE